MVDFRLLLLKRPLLATLFVAGLAVWSPVAPAEAAPKTGPSLPRASICAQIISAGHFIQTAEPNLYPFFVEVKTLKGGRDAQDPLFLEGHTATFRIHSPSLLLGLDEAQLKGVICKLDLVKNPEGWHLASAQVESPECVGDGGIKNGQDPRGVSALNGSEP